MSNEKQITYLYFDNVEFFSLGAMLVTQLALKEFARIYV